MGGSDTTKADLLRRLDRRAEALAAYRAALDLTENAAERAFLSRRMAQISARRESSHPGQRGRLH